MTHIAIFQPADSVGHVPSGIDTFIKGILRWAPEDLQYTHVGATSDPERQTIGEFVSPYPGKNQSRFVPIVSMDARGDRGHVPLIVRYMHALWGHARRGHLNDFQVLDFHRVEPLLLFLRDQRAKNVIIHQDMTVIRDGNSDILWRHAPWLYESIEKRLFRQINRVFTVRQTAVERYRTLYPDIADKFGFVPTWFDPDVFEPAETVERRMELRQALLSTLKLQEPLKLLVFLGRLDRQKNPELLAQAFAKVLQSHPNCHLLMIGDGVLRTQIEKLVLSLGIAAKVSLLGARRPHEISDILRASDLFVLSSAYEGMPFAVLEALACGLPVATTDVGEVRLVVNDGENGAISKNQSDESLCGAITSVIERLPELSGLPCLNAVSAYHPQNVLASIYENHRAQGEMSIAACTHQ